MRFPIRDNNANLEEKSIVFFNSCKPAEWFSTKPSQDYGVDLVVEISEGHEVKGLEFIIQFKASQQPSNNNSNTETIRIDTSTFYLLKEKLQVVLLIKYIAVENDAYWVLLKDIPHPEEGQESFTVHIPRQNTLSDFDWNRLAEYIRRVSQVKLAANRNNNIAF